jgi:adenosylmethionine-8-amino-7-oxononanoate aminotransferase
MPPFELGSVVDLFQWSQLREGEYFGNGPSEVETARQLKRAAWKAKGRKGRETMMTLREYFEREWRSS